MSEPNKIIIDYFEDTKCLAIKSKYYNPTWAKACSKLPNRHYDKEYKAWFVPMSDFHIVEKQLSDFKNSIVYTKRLKELLKNGNIQELIEEANNVIDINFILDWKIDTEKNRDYLVVRFKYDTTWRDVMRSIIGARWAEDHWEVPLIYSSVAADKIFNKIISYKDNGREFKFKRTDAFKENKHKIIESKAEYEEEIKNRKERDSTIQKVVIGYNHDDNKLLIKLDGTDYDFWYRFVKELQHRRFVKEFKRWEIPFKFYRETIDAFKNSGRFDWMISDVCKRRIEEEEEKIQRQEDEIEVLEVTETNLSPEGFENPEGFTRELYDFQKEGVNMLRMGKTFLADEQGLGKTTTLIAFCMYLKQTENIKRVLVVCPNTVKYTAWYSDIIEASNATRVVVDGNDKPQKRLEAINSKAFFTIMNYEAVRLHVDRIVMVKDENGKKKFNKEGNMDLPKYDVVILDEAHRIKNYKTQVTKSINRILTDRKLVATGTPIMNKPEDIASILFWVKPSLFGYGKFKNAYQMYQYFLEQYCEMKRVPTKNFRLVKGADGKTKKKRIYIDKIDGYKNLTNLQKKLDSIMIRRRKKDVLKELPPKIYEPMQIDLYPEQKKMYNEALQEAFLYVNGKEYNNQTMLVKLTRLKQICAGLEVFGCEPCSAKADELATLLEEIIYNDPEDNNKAIIFTEFTEVIDHILIPRFKEYNPVVITGKVKDPKERWKLSEQFRMDINCKLFIGTDKACHAGLTLVAANWVFIYDPPFEFGIYDQAIDRAHRIGQLRSPIIVDLVSRGTVEEKLFGMIKEKRKKSSYIVDNEREGSVSDLEKTSLSLGKKEILQLLS